jgi:charged multivesicular body protein 5
MYKQRCIMVLKKRKQYEAQLKNYMTHQFTLNQVAFTSENIQNTLEMVFFYLFKGQTMQEVIEQQK